MLHGKIEAVTSPFTGQYEIWKAQIQDDGTLTNFVQLTRGPEGQSSLAPTWSSDGRWIAFQRDIQPGADENWQLYVVRANGVGVRALDIAGERPAWQGGDDGGDPPGEGEVFLPSIAR